MTCCATRPSSLVRWRQRIGEAGCEWLLAQSTDAANAGGMIKQCSVQAVVLDTTVQPKAVAHRTDSRLLGRCRAQLVQAAQAEQGWSCGKAKPRWGRWRPSRPNATRMQSSSNECAARSAVACGCTNAASK